MSRPEQLSARSFVVPPRELSDSRIKDSLNNTPMIKERGIDEEEDNGNNSYFEKHKYFRLMKVTSKDTKTASGLKTLS